MHEEDGNEVTVLADYEEFLRGKVQVANETVGEVLDYDLHDSLFPHQQAMVTWALRQRRALIAASFGLGKSRVQCEIARQLHQDTGKRFLLVCPLGVKHQFQLEDGPAMGMDWRYVRTDAELEAATSPYLVTNYERVRDGDIDPRKHDLCGCSLDEGSVLRYMSSKTYGIFEQVFADVPCRFVCTATPSPNNYRELIYYARYLGIMDTGQALTRWFERNPNKAGDLQLHPQHEHDFWLWVASWALFLFAPSDLGYDDTGYALPDLQVHYHRLEVDHTRAWEKADSWGQHSLLLDGAGGSAVDTSERRATMQARIEKAREIIGADPFRHWLVWHHLEDERKLIEREIPDAVTVYGSQDLDLRESRVMDFTHGKIRILASKPELSGSGCNFQRHCHSNVFVGVDYKFQDFIQAIHRTHRFQQSHPVEVHIVYAESQDGIVAALRRKWEQHERLTATMREIVKKYGLSHEAIKGELQRKIGVDRQETKGQRYIIVNNDCVREMPRIASDSIGLIHTSIPFGNHYEYTISYEDFGHNPTDDEFFDQMDFLIPELLRVLSPGRVAAIHVKDRVLYGHQTQSGMLEIDPFSDRTVFAFKRHGFLYEGRRTIVTDVVRENNSTYRLGWTEMCKDATKMGSGLPEYLLLFRKPATSTANSYADDPVVHSKSDYSRGRWQVDAHAFWRSNGNSFVSRKCPVETYDYEAHVKRLEEMDGSLPATFFAEPPISHNGWVWDDIIFMRCLNSSQVIVGRAKHICPLPLDIVQRTIELYSNPGDVVLDPFAGLGTVPVVAVLKDRRAYGVELNEDYYHDAVAYLRDAEVKVMAPTLFDAVRDEVAA